MYNWKYIVLKEIPKTSVFKVKRYLLTKYVQDRNLNETEEMETAAAPASEPVDHTEENTFAVLAGIIEEHAKLTQKVKKTGYDSGTDSGID